MAQQPSEAFLGEDLADAGAIERGVFGGQPGGDLVGGQPFPAQLDHPAAHAFLGRRRPGHPARFTWRGEQIQRALAMVAHQVDHRPPGVAEPGPGLGVGQPVDEVGAQRLVAAVVHLLRRGERGRLVVLC